MRNWIYSEENFLFVSECCVHVATRSTNQCDLYGGRPVSDESHKRTKNSVTQEPGPHSYSERDVLRADPSPIAFTSQSSFCPSTLAEPANSVDRSDWYIAFTATKSSTGNYRTGAQFEKIRSKRTHTFKTNCFSFVGKSGEIKGKSLQC